MQYVCRNDTLDPRDAERTADKKQFREKKESFRGNRVILPERKDLACARKKVSAAAGVTENYDYGSLLVIFDREFSMAVRSAG